MSVTGWPSWMLLLAVMAGIGAGVLGFLSGQPWPTAVLTGLGAAGGALLLWLSYLRLRPVLSGALKARR